MEEMKSAKERTPLELLEEARNMIEQQNYGIADQILEAVINRMVEDQALPKEPNP